MKNVRSLIAGLLALFLLAGCAGLGTPTPTEAVFPTALPSATPTPGPTATAAPSATPIPPPFPVTVTDGLGNEVTVNAKPVKIVSLTLGTDEIMLDMVGPDRLLGVTYLASDATTSNIAARPELKQIKNTVEANPEQIIGLEPDLVLVGSFTKPEVIDQIKHAGITVFVVGNFTGIKPTEDSITTLGKLVGEPDKAASMVADMESKLAEVAGKVGTPATKPRVLYYTSGGYVSGSKTTPDDIITLAGGVNAAAATLTDWQVINAEQVIAINPNVVILSPYVKDDEFLKNPAFAGLDAVKNGKVVAITDAHMSATSQYIVLAVEDVAKLLYPDAFK